MTPLKFIDLTEFRDLGYLEELNRRFLHPLGLAMAVNVDEDGTATFAGIYDDREDPEGWIMGYKSHPDPDNTRDIAKQRAEFVEAEIEKRAEKRIESFGWVIQPAGVDAP